MKILFLLCALNFAFLTQGFANGCLELLPPDEKDPYTKVIEVMMLKPMEVALERWETLFPMMIDEVLSREEVAEAKGVFEHQMRSLAKDMITQKAQILPAEEMAMIAQLDHREIKEKLEGEYGLEQATLLIQSFWAPPRELGYKHLRIRRNFAREPENE